MIQIMINPACYGSTPLDFRENVRVQLHPTLVESHLPGSAPENIPR